MKILVTAFDPFGGEAVNPAALAVQQLPAEIAGATIVTAEVPTVFGIAGEKVAKLIAAENPDAVVCIGQAGGRNAVTPERVAINLRDARIPDNAGEQPLDTPVAAAGPAAYFTTLPVKAMTKAARDAGIPASLSNTAGTFVCNDIMYSVLHHIATTKLPVRAGFIHVPYLPEQAAAHPGEPSMPLADIVTALTAMLAALATCETDISSVEGTIN